MGWVTRFVTHIFINLFYKSIGNAISKPYLFGFIIICLILFIFCLFQIFVELVIF